MRCRLDRHPNLPILLALLALGCAVTAWAHHRAFRRVAWPDECIYLVGARNIVERGTLNTSFYLTHSLLVRGYPHRDVHMPGYVLALSPVVELWGASFAAGVGLNVALFLASIVLVFRLGLFVLGDRTRAAAAAALYCVLPPLPGYLYVVYPELVTTFVFLAGLGWLVRGGGLVHAAVAGLLYASGALFRETLLVALPLYLARIPRRELVRGFMPAALGTLLLVVAPLARQRAVHPNALYPSLFEEALRSETPARALASTLGRNVSQNLRLALEAEPWRNAEDAVLLFLGLLALAAVLGARRLPPEPRRLALASAVSLAALSLAVVVLYVIRARGGVWGGVRVFMSWAPLLLLFALPAVFARRRPWLIGALIVVLSGGFVALDGWQMRFFSRYKASDFEDQDRNARYLAGYLGRYQPHRIVSHSFLYGFENYPVEVVWSLPRGHEQLEALEQAIDFDFISLHESKPLRLQLIRNPRYVRVNKDDRGAEYLIWRRLY